MSRAKISFQHQLGSALVEIMSEHDLLEVVEIEEASGLSLWGWEAYHAELIREGSIMLVSRPASSSDNTGRRVTGFVAARVEAGELHINNVGVQTEHRRQGVGGCLLEKVIEMAKQSGAARASLEVRAGNLNAQKLYQRCGFLVVGRRHKYYQRPVEDALVMRKEFAYEA